MATKFAVETIFKAVDRISGPMSKMTGRINKMSRSLKRGLTAVDKRLSSVNKGMRKAATIGAVALTAAATATAAALNRSADAADALAKQSRRLDFDIEKLQQWQFIAEQSGVSVELLNNSLGAFSKRLGEAAGGSGPLVSGLKNINPELLEQLKGTRSISDALELYIKAIRNADSATEKAALANAAFSRSGLTLVNIADNSAEAIAQMNKEMVENGLISKEAAEDAEAYNDAANRLKRSIAGTIQTALLPLTKLLTPLIDKMREWVITNREIISSRLGAFFQSAAKSIGDFITQVNNSDKMQRFFAALGETVRQVAKGVVFLAENGRDLVKVLLGLQAISIALRVAMVAVTVATVAWNAAAVAITAAMWLWNTATAAMPGILATARAAVLAFNIALATNPIGVVVTAIGLLIAAGALLVTNWESISGFFVDMWEGVKAAFNTAIDGVMMVLNPFLNVIDSVRSIWDQLAGTVSKPINAEINTKQNIITAGDGVASPQEAITRSINENRSSAEVTLRNETNATAEVSQRRGPMNLNIANSGAF